MTSFLGAEIIGSGDRAKAACSRHGEARTKAASADASVLCIPVRASGGWRLSSGARMLAPRSTSLALLGPVGWRHDRLISVSSPQSQKSNHFFVHSPGQDASGRPLPVSMGRNLISKTCWGFDETRARADECRQADATGTPIESRPVSQSVISRSRPARIEARGNPGGGNPILNVR